MRYSLVAAVIGLLASMPGLASEGQPPVVVGQGEIRFLDMRLAPTSYRYDSVAWLDEQSLASGLVRLTTCHRQLDPNGRVVIRFNPERVRSIELESQRGIGSVQIEAERVDMRDVTRGAEICLNLVSRALEPVGEGRWRLHAGPLMRRYLDGYLPMQATLALRWQTGLLAVDRVDPAEQAGVRFMQNAQGAELDMVFAGTLRSTWLLRRP